MTTFILALILAGAMLAIVEAFFPSRPLAAERLGQLSPEAAHPERSAGGNLLRHAAAPLEPLVERLRFSDALDRLLGRARWALTPGEFLIVTGSASVLAAAAAGLLSRHPVVGLLVGVAFLPLPVFLASRAAARQLRAIREQLPDAVLLLANGLRAGNSFLQSLQLVANQVPEPLASELKTVIQEINWGIPYEVALTNLKHRVGSVEVDMVVTASLVQRQTGGNLAEILLNVHEGIRDRVRVEGELRAITSQGRYSGRLLTALPAVLGAVLGVLNPGYIGLLVHDPRGQGLLAGAVCLQVLGTLWIRRVVNVEY